MATNYIGLRGTVETLEAILDRIKKLVIGEGSAAVPAFGTVGIFDVVDLEEALRAFIAAKDRVAVIVFDGANFDNDINGTDAISLQTRSVRILVSDRVMGADRRKALFGDADHPGAMALADLVVEQLSGVLIANPQGVYLRPVGVESLVVSDKQASQNPGRRGYVVHFEARGGKMMKDLGRGPIL
jgi:hypothetical protein